MLGLAGLNFGVRNRRVKESLLGNITFPTRMVDPVVMGTKAEVAIMEADGVAEAVAETDFRCQVFESKVPGVIFFFNFKNS